MIIETRVTKFKTTMAMIGTIAQLVENNGLQQPS